MGSDDGEDRREQRFGRRQGDEVIAYRLATIEEIVKALGPAVSQVARIDDAVDDLERWIADDREARRRYQSEQLAALAGLRQESIEARQALAERWERALAALAAEVRSLKLDQRSGRRALIGSMIAAASTIVVALIGAAALVASHT
jgi:hypothetical protein